ncbi:MAG: hypothetical protein JSV33_12610 [bacterium]|nr:MAG: hypothetical protein JSV33_12610 [bacterium]
MRRQSCSVVAILALCAISVYPGCGDRKDEVLPDVQTGVNLVVNPSFEEWDRSQPVGWKLKHFSGEGENINMFGRSTKESVTGRFSYYLRGLFNTEKWMVLTQRHPVIPGYRLDFAAQIKSVNIKRNRDQEDNANIYVRFLDRDGNRLSDRYYADSYTHHRLGTSDWRRNWKRTDIPKDARFVEIGLINQMTGYLYFDDVELVVTEPLPWKKKKTDHVDFYYLEGHPFPEGSIEREAQLIDGYVRKLDLKLEQRISYYYYPSEERFNEIYNTKKYKQVVSYKMRALHTVSPFENQMIIPLVIFDMGTPPFGLAEGLTLTLRAPHDGLDLHMMAKEYLIAKRIPALYKVLTRKAMQDVKFSITVPAWASFITYIIDRYGMEMFKKLYSESSEIEEAGPFNDVFKELYQKDFPVVDREWRLFVLRYQPEAGDGTEAPAEREGNTVE